MMRQGLTYEYPVMVGFQSLVTTIEPATWQWHEEHEVIIVNSGVLRVMTEETVEILKPGQGIYISGNIMHSLQAEGDKCTFYIVNFHPDFLFDESRPGLRELYLDPVLNAGYFRCIRLDEENSRWEEELLSVMNDLIAANLVKKVGYELCCRGYLYQFWAILLQRVKTHGGSRRKEDNQPLQSLDMERIKGAIKFIEKHYGEQIKLEDIADSVHISKSECCRCFKRSLDLSPIEYVMKYRIYEATRRMIRNPNHSSVSVIATEVGFNNASYFNKIFREYMKCTPSQYKEQIRQAASSQSGGAALFKPYTF